MPYMNQKDNENKDVYFDDIIKWYGYEVIGGRQYRPERFMLINNILDQFHAYNVNGIIIGNIHENPELKELLK